MVHTPCLHGDLRRGGGPFLCVPVSRKHSFMLLLDPRVDMVLTRDHMLPQDGTLKLVGRQEVSSRTQTHLETVCQLPSSCFSQPSPE
jgi:hypothetical protein